MGIEVRVVHLLSPAPDPLRGVLISSKVHVLPNLDGARSTVGLAAWRGRYALSQALPKDSMPPMGGMPKV